MTSRYTHESRTWAKQILTALLPKGVTADISLLREGWGMSIAICGPSSCHTYECGPGLDEYTLIRMAGQWKTGERILPLSGDHEPSKLGQFVDTDDDLKHWVRTAKRGQRVVYFTGNLAQFRADAAKEVVALQTKGDEKPNGSGISAADRVRLTKLQTRLDLLAAINTLSNAAMIELTQLRMSDGSGFTYYAVKR